MIEEFRNYNDQIEVSNLGNVKRDGELIEPYHGKCYDYIVVDGEIARVHNMVGELFPEICGENRKGMHLHHVNHNQRDNSALNLVYLSPSSHIKLHQSEDGASIGVKAYDLEGKYVGQWESKTQAAKETGVDYRHISELVCGIKGRHTAGGYVWFKVDTPEEDVESILAPIIAFHKRKNEERLALEEIKRIKKKKKELKQYKIEEGRKNKIESKKILEFNDKDELIREWKDVKEAAEFHGVSLGAVYASLKGVTLYMKQDGKKWYFRKKSTCQH